MMVDTYSLKAANFKFLSLYHNKTKEHVGNNMAIATTSLEIQHHTKGQILSQSLNPITRCNNVLYFLVVPTVV